MSTCPLAQPSSLYLCPLFRKTAVIGFRAHSYIQEDFFSSFSTTYTCKDPTSKRGHILRFWLAMNLVWDASATLRALRESERGEWPDRWCWMGREQAAKLNVFSRTGLFSTCQVRCGFSLWKMRPKGGRRWFSQSPPRGCALFHFLDLLYI